MAGNSVRFDASLKDNVSPKIKKIDSGFDKIGKNNGFKALAQGVGLGAGVSAWNLLGSAISVGVEFMFDSVNAARDMTESISKSRVVFGGASSDIERFGDTTAKSLGISKRSAIEAASSFGNFFTGLGKSQGIAASMSKKMVTLAADLGSFNNIDPTLVLDKLRAGLAGEAEPLRIMGVFLNEAKVKAKAMELGLADANGELSEGAKVTARYNIILDETKTAQGDAARTSDNLAQKQRQLTAAIDDQQAKLGEKLQPAFLDLTKIALDTTEALGGLSWLFDNEMTPGTIKFVDATVKIPGPLKEAGLKALGLKDNLLQTTSAMANNEDAANAMTPAMLKVAEATEDFHKEAKTAKERSDDLKDSLLTTASALIDGYYDPIEQKEDIADNNRAIREAKRVIRSKTSSDAEIRDAKRVVTERMHQNDLLTADLVKTGSLTKTQFKNSIAAIDERIKQATGAEREYLRKLRADLIKMQNLTIYLNFVNRIRSVGVGATVHAGGLAEGGRVPAGWQGWVGEQGIEWARALPGGGMEVTPASSGVSLGQATAGTSLTINFNSTWPPTPQQAREVATVVDRELHKTLQRSAPTTLRS